MSVTGAGRESQSFWTIRQLRLRASRAIIFLYSKASDQFIYRGPGITGRVTDAQTGQPLQVQIEVKVSKEGYQTEMSSVTITDGPLTVLDVALALGQ